MPVIGQAAAAQMQAVLAAFVLIPPSERVLAISTTSGNTCIQNHLQLEGRGPDLNLAEAYFYLFEKVGLSLVPCALPQVIPQQSEISM